MKTTLLAPCVVLALVPVLVLGPSTRACAASPEVAILATRLHTPQVLRGEFTQRKQIAGFKRPVVSAGDFVVIGGKGILWHTRTPFESTLSITRDRLRVTEGAGKPAMQIDSRREPMLRTLNGLLQGMVVADVELLSGQFSMKARLGAGESWQMDLTPKDPAIGSRFVAIALAGDAWVREVTLTERSGDVTTVSLSRQMEDREPSAAEAGALE